MGPCVKTPSLSEFETSDPASFSSSYDTPPIIAKSSRMLKPVKKSRDLLRHFVVCFKRQSRAKVSNILRRLP